MSLTVAQIVAWRDGLIETRLSGTRLYVDQNGERIEYKSDTEMLRAIGAADSLIAKLQGGTVTTLRFNTSKGL